MTTHPETRLVVVVGLVLVAGWLGLQRHRAHSRTEEALAHQWQIGVNDAASWHFRNGRWVKLDSEQLQQVARDLARRTPGLVRVAGTVRDVDQDQPIPNALVVFANGSGETTITGGPDGRFSREIQPGFYRVFARVDGYLTVVGTNHQPPRAWSRNRDSTKRVAAPVGIFRDQYGVDVDLRVAGRITGTLFDQRGQPVVGALVSAHRHHGLARSRPVLGTDVAEVGLDGRFTLEVVPGAVTLEAAHPDYGGLAYSPSNSLQVEPGDERSVDLTMAKGCVVSGQVVDGRGAPAGPGVLEQFVGGSLSQNFAVVGEIDDLGWFRFATTARQLVALRGSPWKSPPTPLAEFDCTQPSRYDRVRLVLADAEPDLAGVIVSADGNPIPGAPLDLVALGAVGIVRQERADPAGEWAFYDLPPGRYQLSAHVVGRGAVVTVMTVPSLGQRLELSGTGVLMGTVQGMREGAFTLHVDRCRLPVGVDGVLDEVSMASAAITVEVERGEFRVDGLPACPIEARAETPYRTVRFAATIAVDAATVHALDLRQPIAKRIRGVVLDRAQAPAVGVSVLRIPDSGAPRSSLDFAISDGGGRYELRAYSGDRLLFGDAEGSQTTVRVPWTSSGDEEIDVRLSASG